MQDYIKDAAEQAAEMLEPALSTLGELMEDQHQPGPVRIAAAKAMVDYALKLGENREAPADTMAKLDELLTEFRESVGSDRSYRT